MKKIIAALAFAFTSAILASGAQASNCSTYPYTLTNGTTADATQVMANFNLILGCANNNLAHNGANADITSLSGLLTPLSAAQGGTGQSSLSLVDVGTAAKWTAPITLGLSGAVTGSGSVDGSGNVTIATTTGTAQVLELQNRQLTGINNPEVFNASVSFQRRTLNTTVVNTITGASLAANLITLPAGSYSFIVTGSPMATCGGGVQTTHRMYDTTASAVLSYDTKYAPTTGVGCSTAPVSFSGTFTLAGSHAVALDIFTPNNIGYTGVEAGSGLPEVYTDVVITKIG